VICKLSLLVSLHPGDGGDTKQCWRSTCGVNVPVLRQGKIHDDGHSYGDGKGICKFNVVRAVSTSTRWLRKLPGRAIDAVLNPNPFRRFNSLPKVIRMIVMRCVQHPECA